MEFRNVSLNGLNDFLRNFWFGCVAVAQTNFDSCSVINEIVERSASGVMDNGIGQQFGRLMQRILT